MFFCVEAARPCAAMASFNAIRSKEFAPLFT